MVSKELRARLLESQRSEITEYHIYRKLASVTGDPGNRNVLERISDGEKDHYEYWKRFTGEDVAPSRMKVALYYFLARFLGLSFSLKLMENGEGAAQVSYDRLRSLDAGVEKVIADEEGHEKELLALIDEEKLKYAGSMVLGLNDALVELLGALSGFTLALRNTRLIAVVGLITGIAAAMSMAGSEYLSSKEKGEKNPLKASTYTGLAYIGTVIVLIAPYFVFGSPFAALGAAVTFAVIIIFMFTFYISVAKDMVFGAKFREMVSISLGVAALSFLIGMVVRKYFNIDI